MSTNTPIPAYRVTQNDLPDMDKKTLLAIEPLLEALNRCLAAVVAGLNSLSVSTPKSTTFTTDGTGKAQFNLKLPFTPTEVWETSLLSPEGASIMTVYAMTWTPIRSGAAITFLGLAANTSYAFTVRYV